jgi:hypothetical protein
MSPVLGVAGQLQQAMMRITYTEKRAAVVTITPVLGHIPHEPATATVTGAVESSKLIAGTVRSGRRLKAIALPAVVKRAASTRTATLRLG